jgi:lysophospholipase L1-like esterase
MRALAGKALHGDSSWFWRRIDKEKMKRVIATHPALPKFKRLLAEISRLTLERGITLLLIRQPYKYPKHHFTPPNRLYYMYPVSHLHEIMAEVSNEFGVPIVDVEGEFNRMSDKSTLFGDIMHMNAAGYQEFAGVIYQSIVSKGFLRNGVPENRSP